MLYRINRPCEAKSLGVRGSRPPCARAGQLRPGLTDSPLAWGPRWLISSQPGARPARQTLSIHPKAKLQQLQGARCTPTRKCLSARYAEDTQEDLSHAPVCRRGLRQNPRSWVCGGRAVSHPRSPGESTPISADLASWCGPPSNGVLFVCSETRVPTVNRLFPNVQGRRGTKSGPRAGTSASARAESVWPLFGCVRSVRGDQL